MLWYPNPTATGIPQPWAIEVIQLRLSTDPNDGAPVDMGVVYDRAKEYIMAIGPRGGAAVAGAFSVGSIVPGSPQTMTATVTSQVNGHVSFNDAVNGDFVMGTDPDFPAIFIDRLSTLAPGPGGADVVIRGTNPFSSSDIRFNHVPSLPATRFQRNFQGNGVIAVYFAVFSRAFA